MGKEKWRLWQTLVWEEEEFFFRRKMAFSPLSAGATQLPVGARFRSSTMFQHPAMEDNWLSLVSSAKGSEVASGCF